MCAMTRQDFHSLGFFSFPSEKEASPRVTGDILVILNQRFHSFYVFLMETIRTFLLCFHVYFLNIPAVEPLFLVWILCLYIRGEKKLLALSILSFGA